MKKRLYQNMTTTNNITRVIITKFILAMHNVALKQKVLILIITDTRVLLN